MGVQDATIALPPPATVESPPVAAAPVAERPVREDEASSSGLGLVGWWLESAPAWLASGMLHLSVLILLAMLAIGAGRDDRLQLVVGLTEELGEQLLEPSLDLTAATEIELDQQIITPDFLPEVPDPLATPPQAPISPTGEALSSDLPSISPGAALSGRTPGSKAALLKEFGGTAKTENAVLQGLKWLARQQKRDGSWSLVGPYSNGGSKENREAATAMALLAFQGAGKLPGGPTNDFGREVTKGWRWLLDQQQADGSFFHFGGSNHRFYTHAQCTIAICELYAMTGDEQYRDPATKAINYLIKTQSDLGGWRYQPGFDADLSVTGWVVMALKSGRMAGIEVPSPVFEGVEEFLDTVARTDPPARGPRGSRYVYEKTDIFNRESLPVLTSVGLLCREYLGWPGEDRRIRSGVKFLLSHPVEWRRGKIDLYYWYYATQVILHSGSQRWSEWNRVLREVLPDNQVKQGRERGSWDPREGAWHQASGGRLYTTCLAIYTLEVYYRHLPLYKQEAVK